MALLAWLNRWRKTTTSAPSGVNQTVHYVGRDGCARPTVTGAWCRLEQEAVGPDLVETRRYQLEAEWLARRVQQGRDQAGQPYLLRVTYWPWGQESVRLEKYVRDGQHCVEYRRFFGNGDLMMYKHVVGRQLQVDYAYQEPTGEYTYVESMPVYPGGKDQLLQEIGRLIKYPAISLRNKEAGKVFIHFVVRRDGLMTDIRLQKGATPALDAAALQVMYDISVNRWKPGFQNRRAVSVSYTVPITFAL